MRRALNPTPLAAAVILLGIALQVSDGFYVPSAFRMLIAVAVLCTIGLAGLGNRVVPWLRAEPVLVGIMTAGMLLNLVALALAPPGLYLARPEGFNHASLLVGVVSAALLTLVIAWGRAVRYAFLALLATYVGLGVWLIHASPNPQIDVMTVHKAAIEALFNGESPYAISFDNIYERKDEFYSPEVLAGGRVQFGLPYPPLSLLMTIPGQVLGGDIRYAELVALAIGAACIGLMQASRVAPLAAGLMLFTPRTLFILEQGWTEALAICWLGVTVFAASRGLAILPIAFGLLLAVKQYLAVALPLGYLLIRPPFDWRRVWSLIGPALLVVIVFTLPFIIWDPWGFMRSVIWLQLIEPFRLDSLSVLSALARAGWPAEGVWLALAPAVAVVVGLLFSWLVAPRSPAGFAASLGFTLLLTFMFGKKAFCNYYFFIIAALVTAIAAERATRRDIDTA